MRANSHYSLLPFCRNICSLIHNSSRTGREILRRSVMVMFTHYAVASTSCHTRIVLCTSSLHRLPCLFVIPSRYKPGVVLQAVPLLGLLEVCYGSIPVRLPHTRTQCWLRTGVSCPSDRYCVRWVIKCGVLYFLVYVTHMAHISMFYVPLCWTEDQTEYYFK
jgi:hypothetical protein